MKEVLSNIWSAVVENPGKVVNALFFIVFMGLPVFFFGWLAFKSSEMPVETKDREAGPFTVDSVRADMSATGNPVAVIVMRSGLNVEVRSAEGFQPKDTVAIYEPDFGRYVSNKSELCLTSVKHKEYKNSEDVPRCELIENMYNSP